MVRSTKVKNILLRISSVMLVLLFMMEGLMLNARPVTIDFSDGLPNPSIAEITAIGSPPPDLNFSSSGLSFDAVNDGQGILLEPRVFNPACIHWRGLSFDNFSPNQGVQFDIIFGETDVDVFSLIISQTDRIIVTAEENGIRTAQLEAEGEGELDIVLQYAVDWIPVVLGGIPLDGMQIELIDKRTGRPIDFGPDGPFPNVIISTLLGQHKGTRTTSYRMFVIDVEEGEPMIFRGDTDSTAQTVGIESVRIDPNHVPEPSTYLMFGLGALGIVGLRKRQQKKAPCNKETRG